ncbi:MAG: hypothetical protein LBR72_08300 [Oscillospiraceae bacterium]|jgi:hypothetical protein|nr:hypothetical protein [Oscillospiraceae bacterium]
MDGFDEKLNKLLQNPEALAQVAQLARGLQAGRAQQAPAPEPQPSGAPDLGILGALGDLDPKTLSGIAGLLGDLTAKDDRRAVLLAALRPYVRKSRQEKMDRAVQLLQLSKVARRALGMFGQGVL